METGRELGNTLSTYCLNRTMQYGNFCVPVKPDDFCSCLNRTMQYGNFARQNFCRLKISFKSYYVVWKQARGVDIFQGNICLNRTMQYGNHRHHPLPSPVSPCLNRTMQYGNFFKKMKITIREHCLNRTMQYGNFSENIFLRLKKKFKSYYVVWKPPQSPHYMNLRKCLNRTMQYGNFVFSDV